VRLGDVAQAYVVAHEVAHHVQKLLGILQRVAAADQKDPAGENARSVRFELQADCFAGIWMHSRYRRGQLREEDFADALRAAAVVGQRLPAAPRHGHDQTRGLDARLIPAAPAVVDDRVRGGQAVCLRHLRGLAANSSRSCAIYPCKRGGLGPSIKKKAHFRRY
jgi:putative neutral zinc metallopeptidase